MVERIEKSNLLLFLENRTEILDNEIALGMKTYLGWNELTFGGLSILSRRLGKFLIQSGINKGDKLAIISESMPEWGAALFASVLAGSITIPIDIKLTLFEMESILNDCKPKVLIVSNAFLETGLRLKDEIDSIEKVLILDDSGSNTTYPSLYNIPDAPVNVKWPHRALSKTALIIYTSGTTGTPKGVEISFKNALAQVNSIGPCFDLGVGDKFLSILPMNHLFELTVGFLSFLNKGTSIYYSQSLKPKDIFTVMEEKQITFMIVVPAFLKLLKTSIESEIHQMSAFKKMLFNIKYKITRFIPFYSVRKLLFRSIHKNFGGEFKGYISGGAPLDITVGEFFEHLGFRVYEGYGLSEASPVVSVNTKMHHKLGSIGKPIPGVEVKIGENGELMVKGDNVMKGYYNRPELTAEVIEPDGWLHTGDIAKIDKQGFVYITGRIKNMIVLNGGKKVFPEDLEAVFEPSLNFAEVCVFGAKRKGGQKDGTEDIFVAVRASEKFINDIPDEKERETLIKKEIKELSLKLSHYKRPKNVIIVKEAFPRTSTNKVKRKEVKQMLTGE